MNGLAPDTRTPPWVGIARSYLGVREVPGPHTDATIARWLSQLGAWWSEDSTPWCGALPAIVMKECGLAYPKAWYRARAWLSWGNACEPAIGAVAVFERGAGGHVGFIVGRDHMNRLLVLGGNQGDAVSIAPFTRHRLLECRWPAERQMAFQFTGDLPLLASTAPTSRNEV
jgi:uncharacterized protein (TIGR02594 family)